MGLVDRLLGRPASEALDGPRVVRALADGVVVAESDRAVVVEGNHYFPPDAIRWGHFKETDQHTVCPWKGTASYYDIIVGQKKLGNAAWTYHDPSPAAARLTDYVAFYKHKVKVG